MANLAIFLSDYFLYILIIFLMGYIFYRQYRILYFSIYTILALGSAWVLSKIFKALIKIPRPFIEHQFNPVVLETGYSFPSSHATVAFALATAAYFYDKKLGLYFGVFALFISLSRVVLGVHYPLDILGGMVLGTISGFIISRIFIKYF